MEWAMHPLEKKELKADPSKHHIYGTFLLGSLKEKAYIHHLNGKVFGKKPISKTAKIK